MATYHYSVKVAYSGVRGVSSTNEKSDTTLDAPAGIVTLAGVETTGFVPAIETGKPPAGAASVRATVHVESEVGRGSVFRVTFPTPPAAAPQP